MKNTYQDYTGANLLGERQTPSKIITDPEEIRKLDERLKRKYDEELEAEKERKKKGRASGERKEREKGGEIQPLQSSLENVLVFSSAGEIFVLDNLLNSIPVRIASRNNWVQALCSHNGQLYDGGRYNKIFETLTNKEIASRDDWVRALCSHNGQLYDGGSYNKIFETLTNKEIASRDDWVRALCSHPRKYFVEKGLLKEVA